MTRQKEHPVDSSDHFLCRESLRSINDISSDSWNRNIPADCPFLRHEFLSALETTGCVSEQTGWQPQHIVIRKTRGTDSGALAVSPLYLKHHSYGEFIFDWQWASAYHRFGNPYYPKIVSQSPFTPLSAPKLLISDKANTALIRTELIETTQEFAKISNASSIHWLFIQDDEADEFETRGMITRYSTYEYVWHNHGYESMDDFLATLVSRKRKKIRQERKSVAANEITVSVIEGEDLKPRHWDIFEQFYQKTISKYYAYQYLSYEFFQMIGETMPENIVMFLAFAEDTPIAGSLCLKGGGQLFGRYWGALFEVPNLHFETCYYSAIEYCIENGFKAYNAGVQGEHKLNRGFVPQPACSAHFIEHPGFDQAIRQHVEYEGAFIRERQNELNAASPFSKHR